MKLSFPKDRFMWNTVTLITGTSIAHAISLAVLPFLTRLFSPADFGVFAIYMSVSAFLCIFVTGRYDLSIMLPEKDEDAVNIMALSMLICLAVSLIVLVAVWIFGESIARMSGRPEISRWLFFLPLSMLLYGIYLVLFYWSNRSQSYRRISTSRVAKSTGSGGVNLGIGVSSPGAFGLIVGEIAGQGVEAGVLGWNFWRLDRHRAGDVSFGKMRNQAARYINFPRYSLPAEFVTVASQRIPIILMSIYFQTTIVGYYTLTQRILGAPVSLISSSILAVFREEANRDYRDLGNCQDIFIRTFKRLILLAFIPFIFFLFLSPWLFTLILGAAWKEAGVYAQFMSVMFFLQFVAVPMSYVLYAAEKQVYDLYGQIVLLAALALLIFTGIYFESPRISIIGVSLAYSLYYIFCLVVSFHFSKGKAGDISGINTL